MESKKYIICDIDGTIADHTHRLKYIEQQTKDWDKFFQECVNDKRIDTIVEMLIPLTDTDRYKVLYITGRPERIRDLTEKWLFLNCLPDGAVLMRANGDRREDFVVKKELFESIISSIDVAFVLEDRTQVVKMWRELGLTCLQVKEGDY